jgi:acyl-CoA reductase-like NAD-dependent aldehyde dehydrogenase
VRSFGEAMQVFGNPVPVLQLVTGPGSTGEALARSGVAKIAFTGSAATARKVMAAAADTLTPVLAECGGKDALLVAADADLDAAADAAAWGAMSNAGQTCVGIERVYVADAVYHSFLERLTTKVSALRPGSDLEASYGPMTLPSQTEVVAKHVADALARGGRAVVGGPVVNGTDAVEPPFVRPVVLADVPETSTAVTEETFGPTVTVTPVVNMAEAVSYANAGRYGLGSAVFTRDRRAGMNAARSLRSGMTSINSVIGFAVVPALPFGGVGESGFGRIHGADGLREFTRAKAITRQRMRPLVNVLTFGRSDRDMRRLMTLVTLLHGRLYRPRGSRRGR